MTGAVKVGWGTLEKRFIAKADKRPRAETWGRYHGGTRPSSDDSFHSPTVIPPSALDILSIMKHNHCQRTCSRTSPRRSTTMVTLHDTRFVECRWWNDGWAGKTVVTRRSSASMIPALGDSHASTTSLPDTRTAREATPRFPSTPTAWFRNVTLSRLTSTKRRKLVIVSLLIPVNRQAHVSKAR